MSAQDETLNIAKHDPAAEARARIAMLTDSHLTGDHPLLKTAPAGEPPKTEEKPISKLVSPAMPAGMPAEWVGNKRRIRPLPSKTRPIVSAIASFALLLVVFKSEVIISQVKYWTGSKNQAKVAIQAQPASSKPEVGPAPLIDIPKIKVHAPVVDVPTNQESAVLRGLQDGVVLYANTARPGQPGNSVIFGHSSNDWWQPGNYKFVFVLLDKLIVGDRFSVNYKSKRYVYEVTKIKIVVPTDLSVLASTSEPTMTLITCTPPGTSWKRLVVSAKQISPAPQIVHVTAPTETNKGSFIKLPGNAPDLLQQITDFFGRIFSGLKGIFT